MQLLLLLLKHPVATLTFTYTWAAQSFLVVLRRVLLPHIPVYQSLRTQLQRAYLSACSATFPDLTHRLPVGPVPDSRARRLLGVDFEAYIIPGSKSDLLDGVSQADARPRCVALYAHGGGYARGEAKMYLNYMERWVTVAQAADLNLVFMSVEYREYDPAY